MLHSFITYVKPKLNSQFWQRLVVVTSLSILGVFLVNKTAHLYIDKQGDTSITNHHYYLINQWSALPQHTVFSVYRSYYQQLSPQQKQQFRAYTYSVWHKHQPLSIVNLWLAQHFLPSTSNTVGTVEHMITPIDDLPSVFYLHALAQSIYGLKNHKLVPQLPYDQNLVKYVVAKANDIVTLTPQGSFINGVFVKAYPLAVQALVAKRLTVKEFTLKPNQYWVIGDNPQSIDSNFFGPVEVNQFFGKVWWSK